MAATEMSSTFSGMIVTNEIIVYMVFINIADN